jgi:hypothetical protein
MASLLYSITNLFPAQIHLSQSSEKFEELLLCRLALPTFILDTKPKSVSIIWALETEKIL